LVVVLFLITRLPNLSSERIPLLGALQEDKFGNFAIVNDLSTKETTLSDGFLFTMSKFFI